jgi:hypothetical protein
MKPTCTITRIARKMTANHWVVRFPAKLAGQDYRHGKSALEFFV